MKKGIVFGVLICLLLCGFIPARRQDDMETVAGAQNFRDTEAAFYANVRDYGAVGDAMYHHPLGEPADEWLYWAGHFSRIATARYHIPCFGEDNDMAFQVIADSAPPAGRQIRLSEVNPGQTSYTPSVGDIVVEYTGADMSASVLATDDSAAFETAIRAGEGFLYLPEGDYLISQLTAVKIKDLKGPGKVWLKEWMGGSVYYLAAGISDVLLYKNYGWIDEKHFHDDIWRDMHWVTCLPQVRGWTSSMEFTGNISPRMEFDFHSTRDNLNVWLTVQPAVEEEAFPDSVTVCIMDMSANYTEKGSRKWSRAAGGGTGGGFFRLSWDGTSENISEPAWKDCGSWVEITLQKEDLFRQNENGEMELWGLHCWSTDSESLDGRAVEFVCNTARVWLKEEGMDGCLMCDIGGDMRTSWENRGVKEGFILEACDSAVQYLTSHPRRFYAYTVPDEEYEHYWPFPS